MKISGIVPVDISPTVAPNIIRNIKGPVHRITQRSKTDFDKQANKPKWGA